MSAPTQDVVVEPDEFDDNDSSLGDVGAPSTFSLNSSILDYRKENGRTYHKYRDGKYHFPNDEEENERLDLQHHIFDLSLDGKLGLSPPNAPEARVGRVLDLGTGTGIWAMDYGDEHPGAEVIGVDLSPIQPEFVPPNVKFEVDDIEDSWTYTRPFDYIHSRMMNSSICKWEEYLRQSYKHLNPGGWLELQEFNLPVSDDGTLTSDHALHRSMRLLGEAAAKTDRAFVDLDALKPMMEAAGFVDAAEMRFKWPSNTWPRDGRYKELGAWNHENITRGLQGFLMAALTRGLGWNADEVNVLAAQARKDVGDRSIHAYWPMIVVYGRKPLAA
ncbi:S-adenosyl-L-methionine-dependent methyltransferase [Colletotrichum navitas]|uniref:S-adenosyl-L-methionine-dependent methyltransferase n=1 Tax=Colletotrichum navitas TaxID=681940 RepID=A0AAD8PT02_9PEZI|nr:S-adenosyl-L-methionine-dependent methyltransferase [Colletotrichum navitas]KAK1580171.1 S-adenosyl-L-methionine-dependent methyltransferase [Colletotrichum navitas]